MFVTPPTDPPGGAGGPDGEHSEPENGDWEVGGLSAPEPGGWLPPENRTWRHPSELHGVGAIGPAGPDAHKPRPPRRATSAADLAGHRRRLWTMGAVGTVGLAAAVGGALLLASSGTGNLVVTGAVAGPTSTSFTAATDPGSGPGLPDDAHAMVALDVVGPSGTTTVCGVAVAPGGLVAAPYSALARARSTWVVTQSGVDRAVTTVAVDPDSDLALLRVPERLPLPPAGHTVAVAPGTAAQVVTRTATHSWGGEPAVVRSVGSAGSARAQGLSTIVASVSGATPETGAVLASPEGTVLGVLAGTGPQGTDVFLPDQLVVGVSRELARQGTVHHGWLDVELEDQSGPRPGTLVAAVDPHGAAARRLFPGDVIARIDRSPVRTAADLRSRLYLLSPGATVSLTVERGRRTLQVAVELGST